MTAAPTRMITSPRLNTLANGTPAGIAKLSPSQARCGWARTAELVKSPGSIAQPARRSAAAEAGSDPPFTAIVIPFRAAPRASSGNPAIRRLRTRNPAASR